MANHDAAIEAYRLWRRHREEGALWNDFDDHCKRHGFTKEQRDGVLRLYNQFRGKPL